MKIVVLDGYTLNPGDLDWDDLKSLGDCPVHERTPADAVIARAADAEILLTNKVVLDAGVLARLPRLRYIGVLATGYNVVDVEAARKRGIVVTNVPAYSTRSVAQLTFALLLELAHHVGHHAHTVREGRWSRCADFSYADTPLVELEGRTMGVVGLGRIGMAVAEIAAAFGMHGVAHTRSRPRATSVPVRLVGLEPLFRESDVVSLHCPLTPETRHLINAERLAWMKPTAFLLNTGRGALVDEAALADALNHGRLAGAGLDVLSTEPPPIANPLLQARNCVITPHFGWATGAARRRLMRIAVDNVRAFLQGAPRNVVN
jgi:glycerate dehydrogenase